MREWYSNTCTVYEETPHVHDFAPQPFPKFPFIFSSARLIVFQQTGRGERQEKMYYDIWLYLLGRRLTLNHSNLKPSLFISPLLSHSLSHISYPDSTFFSLSLAIRIFFFKNPFCKYFWNSSLIFVHPSAARKE
jgi:hypothetical protein